MSEIQYDSACVDCRHDAGKDAPDTTWQCSAHVRAERDFLRSKLATKWTIEERYEAACGDRDGLSRMVETLREQLARTVSERDSWHAEVEGWHETSARLRERLDQFEAYDITVASALDSRARCERLEIERDEFARAEDRERTRAECALVEVARLEWALRPFVDPESYSTAEEECRQNPAMAWCAVHSFRWPCPVGPARAALAGGGE